MTMAEVAQEKQSKKWQIDIAPYTSELAIYTPIDVLNMAKTYMGTLAIQNYIRRASLCELRRVMKAMHSVCSDEIGRASCRERV